MSEVRRFARGETVLHRIPFVDESGLSGPPVIADVKPMVVVEDSDALVSLWLPAGTRTKLPIPLDRDQPKPWREGEWTLADSAWKRWSALFLTVPGEWRSTWVMWTPEMEFLGWYVNLQEPLERTPLGFDTRDLQLDIRVDTNREWTWKDIDDLERSVETGVISQPVADRAWAEGHRAVADIEAGRWPFTEEWAAWEPDPDWPVPELLHGAATVRLY